MPDDLLKNQIDLGDPKNFNDLSLVMSDIITFDQTADAKELADNLDVLLKADPNLKNTKPDYYSYYLKAIYKCRWVSLSYLSDNEIVDQFRNRFMLIFAENDFNTWSKLKEKLVTIPTAEGRDILKKKIVESLNVNRERFTDENITKGDKTMAGTVGNWLADYSAEVGTDLVESIKFTQYLMAAPNTKSLKPTSREKLSKLIRFYERLKLPSGTVAGYEGILTFLDEREPGILMDGKYYRVDLDKLILDIDRAGTALKQAGIIAPAPALEVSATPMAEEKAKLKESKVLIPTVSAAVQRKILEEEQLLAKQTGSLPDKLAAQLSSLINLPLGKKIEKEKVIAVLRLLIRSKKLDDLIYRNLDINREIQSIIKDPAKMEGFKINPKDPAFIKIFIRHILISRLFLNEKESARIAVQLSDLAKEVGWDKGTKLASFDSDSNTFKWI